MRARKGSPARCPNVCHSGDSPGTPPCGGARATAKFEYVTRPTPRFVHSRPIAALHGAMILQTLDALSFPLVMLTVGWTNLI